MVLLTHTFTSSCHYGNLLDNNLSSCHKVVSMLSSFFASSPKWASLITSSRVSQVLGRLSLLSLNPCSHWQSSSLLHTAGSLWQVVAMILRSDSPKFSMVPTCFHRGAISSTMKRQCCSSCSSLYLKQVSVRRSRASPTKHNYTCCKINVVHICTNW